MDAIIIVYMLTQLLLSPHWTNSYYIDVINFVNICQLDVHLWRVIRKLNVHVLQTKCPYINAESLSYKGFQRP